MAKADANSEHDTRDGPAEENELAETSERTVVDGKILATFSAEQATKEAARQATREAASEGTSDAAGALEARLLAEIPAEQSALSGSSPPPPTDVFGNDEDWSAVASRDPSVVHAESQARIDLGDVLAAAAPDGDGAGAPLGAADDFMNDVAPPEKPSGSGPRPIFQDPASLGDAFPSERVARPAAPAAGALAPPPSSPSPADGLGLAFPDEPATDPDQHEPPTPAAGAPVEPRVPTAILAKPTMARPSLPREATLPFVPPEGDRVVPGRRRPTGPLDSVLSASQPTAPDRGPNTAAVEDAWAGVDAQPGGWRSLTGESSIAHGEAVDGQPARGKTNIFVLGNEVQPEKGARLECANGPESGKEFALMREATLGRASTCTIIVTEASVSREHARLYRDGDEYILVDKKSGNGTFVNGERIARRALRHGDLVSLGHCELHFWAAGKPSQVTAAPADADAAAGASESPSTPNDLRTVILPAVMSIANVVFLMVIVLGVVAWRRGPTTPREDTAFAYFQAGVDAWRARDFDAAKTQFEIFAGLEPANEHGHRYLEALERQKSNMQAFAAMRASFEQGDLANAYARATALVDSPDANEAIEISRAIERELEARLGRARQALDAGRSTEAVELLHWVQRVRPNAPEVASLLARAEGGGTATLAPATSSRPLAPAAQNATPRSAAPAPIRGGGPVLARAVAQFAEGDIDEALATAADAPSGDEANMLIAKIHKFKQIYDNGLEEYKAKRAEPARRLLEQAKGFAGKITGDRPTKLAADLNRKLADMHYVSGIQALLAQSFGQAAASFRAALALNPEHVQARKKDDELQQRAEGVLDDAEALRPRDRDLARMRYRQVLQIARPQSEAYRRARQRLDAMP